MSGCRPSASNDSQPGVSSAVVVCMKRILITRLKIRDALEAFAPGCAPDRAEPGEGLLTHSDVAGAEHGRGGQSPLIRFSIRVVFSEW